MHAQLNHSRGVYNVLTHALHFKKQQKILMLPKRKVVVKLRFLEEQSGRKLLYVYMSQTCLTCLKRMWSSKKKYKHILRVT